MSPQQQLEHERELQQLATSVCRDGLPFPHRPEATMALAVAVRDALRNAADPSRAAQAAALATRVFDLTMRSIPPSHSGGEIACKVGCTYCCHNVVMATAPEVFLAASELRSRRDAQFVADVAGRCEAVRPTVGIRRNPCPLLHEALCSVYAARPTVCRKHTSFLVTACIDDYEGKPCNIPIRRFDQLVFECCAVALLVGMRLWDARPGAVFELSGALAVALQDPQVEERWLAGEAVFAAVPSQEKLPGIDEHAAFLWSRFAS
jgi:hypothetical protein